MTVPDIKTLAAQGRQAFRKMLVERDSGTREDLPPPVPTGVIDITDGTIGRAYNYADLPVPIPSWINTPNPEQDNEVFLYWAPGHNPSEGLYEEVDSRLIDGSNMPTFPLDMVIPLRFWETREGAFTIKYHVRLANFDTIESGLFPGIRDTKAPYADHVDGPEPRALILPAELEDADLAAAEATGVLGTIPDYVDAGRQPKDRVAYWWVNEVPTFDPSDPNAPQPIAIIEVPPDLKISFPVDMIRDVGDGGCYAAYSLIDKAGNRTPLSHPTPVGVAIGAMPDNLSIPTVPQALVKGFVNQQDANDGIFVAIEEFNNHKSKDEIEVTWGSSKLDAEPIGTSPRWPKLIRVPDAVLFNEYDWDTGGQVTTDISYIFLRGTVERGPFENDVDVDFSYPGPENPDYPEDWPKPINPGLTAGIVYGQSTPTVPNVLSRQDDGNPAKFHFTLYDPTTADEDCVVEFYWGAAHVTELDFTLTGGEGGEDRVVDIPWNYIRDEGNHPKVLVYYRVWNPVSGNDQRSPFTEVNVDAVTYKPDAPIFEGVNAGNFITCGVLYDPPYDPANPGNGNPADPAVRLRIPDLSKDLENGDDVILEWTAYQHLQPDEDEIVATYTQTIELGGTTPVTGFVWRIPYIDYVLPIYIPETSPDGFARATYSFVHKVTGETITSEVAGVKVGMYETNGPCPIPPTGP